MGPQSPDPDNRRSIDFELRRSLLQKLQGHSGNDFDTFLSCLIRNWHNGAIKLVVFSTLLAFRHDHSALFGEGTYEPLVIGEETRERICAYLRVAGQKVCMAAASLGAPATHESRRSSNSAWIECPCL
jgi:(1->4)-alpha-D-glucan 1-alpha-D-glucosylmutase